MQLLRDDLLGLEAKIGGAPCPGHDDRRAHVAQLGRDWLGDTIGDDRVECAIAAGDVNLVDQRVRAQRLPDLGIAIREAQKPALDQRPQRILEDRPEIFIDRVHLQNADRAFGDQFIQHVERRDRRNISRTENERNARLRRGLLVPHCHCRFEGLACDAGLHPYLRVNAREQDAIVQTVRENVDHEMAVGPLMHAAGGSAAIRRVQARAAYGRTG